MDFPKRVSDHWVIARLNDIPIGRKLVGLFLFCVLIPLLITDTFVLWMLAPQGLRRIFISTNRSTIFWIRIFKPRWITITITGG